MASRAEETAAHHNVAYRASGDVQYKPVGNGWWVRCNSINPSLWVLMNPEGHVIRHSVYPHLFQSELEARVWALNQGGEDR